MRFFVSIISKKKKLVLLLILSALLMDLHTQLFSFMVNGYSKAYLPSSRGVHQGDPFRQVFSLLPEKFK